MMSKKLFRISLVPLFFLSACHTPAPLQNLIELITGPELVVQEAPTPVPTPDNSLSLLPDLSTPTPASGILQVKCSAEMITEMFQVIFQKTEIEDKALYSSLVSTLEQGASLEGIYNGLVFGPRYRLLESKAKAASPESIKFFAKELTEVQKGMMSPTVFTNELTKLVPSINNPMAHAHNTLGVLGKAQEKATPIPTPPPLPTTLSSPADAVAKAPTQTVEEMLNNFIGVTPFTLKRMLCDEAMKKIDELKNSPTELAQWYAGVAVRMSGYNVEFGLPARNSSDFDSYVPVAKTMSPDQMKWEVLNRYQRVMNQLNQAN